MLHQKRSELLRLLFIVAMLALTVGVVLVLSANNPTAPVKTTPSFVNASANHTINFTITNPAGSTEIDAVRVQKASGFTTIDCGVKLPPGWSCDDTSSTLQVDFVSGGTGIAAGVLNNVSFMINGIAPSTTGNQTFLITPYEGSIADGTQNTTLNPVNSTVTVDADSPLIGEVNISDGGRIRNASKGTQWVNGSDLVINISISDIHSGINAASVYYNFSNYSLQPVFSMPHPTRAATYDSTVLALTAAGNVNEYTATIPASRMINGTIVYFTIVANDTVKNKNVSNLSAIIEASSTFNVSVDSATPLLRASPNITAEFDARDDRILTSLVNVTITINVSDYSGSGVSRVDVNASATTGWVNMTQNGTSEFWYYNGSLSSLGVAAGDKNLTLYFRAFDNVSNANESLATLNVLVDDDAPQFAVGLLAPTNAIEEVVRNNFTTSNTSVLNFSILIYGNLNYTGSTYANSTVATIMGPDGRVYNLSFISKTSAWGTIGRTDEMVYSTLWHTAQSPQSGGAPESSLNSTNSTLVTLGCGQIERDGGVCPILINVTDIFGRSNSTNISITFDNVSASVTNITSNATSAAVRVVRSGSIINFTVSASNNIQNVSIHNSTTGGQLTNATVLTAVGGTGNYSIALGANLVCGGGVEGTCTVNFSVVDKALNINRSGVAGAKAQGASTTFIVDNSAPLVSNFLVGETAQYENQSGTGTVRLARSDLNLTITFNVTDQITNVTQVRIGNATMRNASFATAGIPDGNKNISTLAAFGCPTNVENASCILTVYAVDNLSIDNFGNQNSTVNLTFTIDDLAPRVVNFSTDLINGLVRNVTSVTTKVINFSVNVTESNLPDKNVSIRSTTSIKMNKTGSFNVNATGASNSSSVTWWAMANLNDLGCTSDGDCTITVVANDSAGNVNNSVSIVVTSDSSGLSIMNRTFGAVFLFDSTPTLYVNTSKAALCRYSTTGVIGYSQMSTQFDSQGTRHNSFTLAATADGSYEYDVSCVDVAGTSEMNNTVKFTIDTINDTVISIDNRTQNVVFYFDNTPTITVNLSANALCRYSSTTGVLNYTTMTQPFNVNGTRHNSFTLAATADGSYTYDVACATANEQNVVSGTVTFTVDTINDTTINIDNSTQNVVFYFDNTPTITVNLSANALCRYSSTGGNNYTLMTSPFNVNGTRHNSFTLAATADDSYTYGVACATSNEQNVVTGTVTFTVDTVNDTTIAISNLTDTGSTFIAATPTVHVNLSANAVCRYSGAGGTYVFSDMTTPFGVNGTRHNSFTITGDLRDNDYAYPVACTTANGQNNVTGTVRFAVDTTSLWNITIGATGALSATKDYFTQAKRFYTFRLPKTNILDTTAVNARYNVTDVLASVMGASPGTAATNNLSVIYAYNRTGNSWTSFVFGRATNSFTNFTSDVMDYYVNFTVANERIEIN